MWDKIAEWGKKALGLTGKSNGLSGLIHKAKNFVSNGMKTLNSSPVKNIISTVTKYAPMVGDLFGSAKKYGNIANNVLNKGGIQKTVERKFNNDEDFQDMRRNFNKLDGGRKTRDRRVPTIERGGYKEPAKSDEYLGDHFLSSMFA